MMKIFWRLTKNSRYVAAAAASNSNSNCNFNLNFSTTSNILYTYNEKKPFDKHVSSKVSVLTYPFTDAALHSFEYDGNWRVCGHSHNLVCFSDTERYMFLYNSVTHNFLRLPSSVFLLYFLYASRRNYLVGVGLGYDTKSKDFKVVRLANIKEIGDRTNKTSVEVYNLSTHQWREIKTPVFGRCSIDHVSDGICHEGFYYWIVRSNSYDKYFIQSFDMSEEVFHSILIPTVSKRNYTHKIMVWNGMVVVITFPLMWVAVERRFDIWTLDKDEFGAVSWSKLLTIDPFLKTYWPLLFVNFNELLMGDYEGEVISYNVETQVLKDLPVKAEQAVII